MKLFPLLLFVGALSANAQEASPPPKKNPFEGWGAALDRPAAPASRKGPAGPLQPAAPPAHSEAGMASMLVPNSKGIVLNDRIDAPLSIGSGGPTQQIQDVRALLTPFGEPKDDEEPHPHLQIYPGIPYLAKQDAAEHVLVPDYTGLKSTNTVSCGGFPPGLLSVSYDGHWLNAYDRLYIVTDRAGQVLTLEFTAPRSFVPPGPWQIPLGRWHVYDFVNARVKNAPNTVVHRIIRDERGFIAVTTTSTSPPFQTSTWYIPKPFVNLMLYCASKSAAN